jgi:hypothetical protein
MLLPFLLDMQNACVIYEKQLVGLVECRET